MVFDPDRHHCRSICLPGYAYTSSKAYFITLCTQGRQCLFGWISAGEVVLNDAGNMIRRIWQALPDHYPHIGISDHVIMSDHFHGIIHLNNPVNLPSLHKSAPSNDDTRKLSIPEIVGAGPCACPDFPYPFATSTSTPTTTRTFSLTDAVHQFKSLTTARYQHGVYHHQWPAFSGRWVRAPAGCCLPDSKLKPKAGPRS